MKNNLVCCPLCVLKRSSNYGFANATDLTCFGGRPAEAVQRGLAAPNLKWAQILFGDDVWVAVQCLTNKEWLSR